MRALLAGLLLLPVAACGSATSPDVVRDPVASATPSSTPTEAAAPQPVPTEPVRTTGLVTVIQQGSAPPQVCLGDVAESYPPQCSGPEVTGFDWGQGSEHQGQVRWGSYALTGRWDGTRLAVTGAIGAALYDPAFVPPSAPPTPLAAYSAAELDHIAGELRQQPGVVSAAALESHVLADVYHDDGSVQAWADQTYGDDAVVVSSAFVPAR